MELILWRHCDAESGAPDDLRALTPRGQKDAHRMARWLLSRLPAGCRIVASPAVRAQQTARALGRGFETLPELSPGASVDAVLQAAGWPDALPPTLVVGHEPTLGRVAAYVSTGAAEDQPIAKGGIVWVVSNPQPSGAEGSITLRASPDFLPDPDR